jgi:hypothetical protein
MATWPNATISTANVDAGNDLPRLARSQIRDTIDAVNSISSMPSGEFHVIKFTGLHTRPDTHIPGNYTWYPLMTSAYSSGNAFVQFRANIRSNTAIATGPVVSLPAGRYEVSFIDTSIMAYANGIQYIGSISTTLNANPGSITGNANYGVGYVQTSTGPTHAEVTFEGPGGVGPNFFDVPSHLVIDQQRIDTQANGGGFYGPPCGILENQPPTGRPDIQYIKFQRISY